MGRGLTRRELLITAVAATVGGGAGMVGARWTMTTELPRAPISDDREMAPPASLAILHAGLAARRVVPCRLFFAGSSTTAGTAASMPSARYVDLMVASLQRIYSSGTGHEATVAVSPQGDFGTPGPAVGVQGYNLGRRGATAADYLDAATIRRVAALDPCAVVHVVGSNDFRDGVPPDVYQTRVERHLRSLRGATVQPCVHVLVQSYERFDGASSAYSWSAYGEALADIATANADDVVFLDISDAYFRVGVPGGDPFELLVADRIHQSDAGHAFMADLLLAELLLP